MDKQMQQLLEAMVYFREVLDTEIMEYYNLEVVQTIQAALGGI